jgi:hypothetical protein
MFAIFSMGLEIQLTKKQAQKGGHIGDCEADVRELLKVPAIAKQFSTLNPEKIKQELREYGAWTDEELQDIEMNKVRILWEACGQICDNIK